LAHGTGGICASRGGVHTPSHAPSTSKGDGFFGSSESLTGILPEVVRPYRTSDGRELLVSAGAQPGGRAPAPGGLALVQAFVNTVDLEHGPDLLDETTG
jgi:hypothetical protein